MSKTKRNLLLQRKMHTPIDEMLEEDEDSYGEIGKVKKDNFDVDISSKDRSKSLRNT